MCLSSSNLPPPVSSPHYPHRVLRHHHRRPRHHHLHHLFPNAQCSLSLSVLNLNYYPLCLLPRFFCEYFVRPNVVNHTLERVGHTDWMHGSPRGLVNVFHTCVMRSVRSLFTFWFSRCAWSTLMFARGKYMTLPSQVLHSDISFSPTRWWMSTTFVSLFTVRLTFRICVHRSFFVGFPPNHSVRHRRLRILKVVSVIYACLECYHTPIC